MLNFTLYEDGNGGQLVLRNNEIAQTRSLATLAYLKMFGGNVLEKTKKENNTAELRTDWWANDPVDNSEKWINSETEKVLQGIEISSSSRYTIEQAVKNDVESLETFGSVDVFVAFPGPNDIRITITITEPNAKSSSRLNVTWDASKNEIIEKDII